MSGDPNLGHIIAAVLLALALAAALWVWTDRPGGLLSQRGVLDQLIDTNR